MSICLPGTIPRDNAQLEASSITVPSFPIRRVIVTSSVMSRDRRIDHVPDNCLEMWARLKLVYWDSSITYSAPLRLPEDETDDAIDAAELIVL